MKYFIIALLILGISCTKEEMNFNAVNVNNMEYETLSSSCQVGFQTGFYSECSWQTRFMMNGLEYVVSANARNVSCNDIRQGESYEWKVTLDAPGQQDQYYEFKGRDIVEWDAHSFTIHPIVLKSFYGKPNVSLQTRGSVSCSR